MEFHALSIAAVVLMVSTAGCVADGPRTSLGDELPHFSGTDVDGNPFDSNALDGEISVLHFLAVGAEGEPELGLESIKAIAANVSDVPGVAFVTIYFTVDHPNSPQKEWDEEGRAHNVSWPVLPDTRARIISKLSVGGYGPTSAVVVDREGLVRVVTNDSADCLQQAIHDINENRGHFGLVC